MSMTMEELQLEYKNFIENDFENNKISGKEALKYLDNSTAKYKGQTIYSLFMGKVFPKYVVEKLKSEAELMHGILLKVMREFIKDPSYRKLFGFEPELEELILNIPQYDDLLPIARIDIFLNEKDLSYKYCEFNADGSSSMNEDRELNIALKKTKAYQKLSEKYKLSSFELFDSWVDEFLNIYQTIPESKDKPNVAIIDFLEKGCSMLEFNEFGNSFKKRGCEAEIAEIRDLTFDGENLYTKSGMRIDAIYRRAVTSDIMNHIEEVGPFMEAVKSHKVCLIGSFCTHIIHNKILFCILHKERTRIFLNNAEIEYIKEHIPYTVSLSSEAVEQNKVLIEKDKWLIKPEDSYGAKGIFAGIHFSNDEWEKAISENKDTKYVLQEFIYPYQSYNIDFHKEDPEFNKYSNLTGMYMYNGKLAGFYSRQSGVEIISDEYDENDIGTFMAEV